jgi:hypothetical protein
VANQVLNNNKSLGTVISELKLEIREFIQTRIEMLRAEIGEKISAWKVAIPVMAIAILLALTAFFLLTGALVAAIAPAFEGPFAWALALLIVGFGYLLIAGIAAWMAYREVSSEGLAPNRTIRVLKQDQAWFQSEARSQL